MSTYQNKLAVLFEGQGYLPSFHALAERLNVPLRQSTDLNPETFFLTWRDGELKLLDKELLKKGGLSVDILPRHGEQRSYPAPKEGAFAQAIGRKTKTIVDATTGWAQDSLCLFRMGYEVSCIERSPMMAELLADAFMRLEQELWVQKLELAPPILMKGNAIELLQNLETPPDCIYLDPMFPPKRKKSALSKKSMTILQELVGEDLDKTELFEAAFAATGKRVVVKSPDYAEPLGAKPNESFSGKLLRYDVYFKN
ncbi:MAG: class I SAM-dependent methyltransferase [Methylococcales bacterium]|nr:class I SAM-dependent methyltransferase [Methylococcales bacterium]MDD5754602.1 class I SAM-dependent methyltransferase [Methylococcales bacterium]